MRRFIDIVTGRAHTLREGAEPLAEAPVTDYQLHGDFSKPDSFGHPDYPVSAPDHRVLSSPKGAEKIKRLFSKCPFNFALHFINAPAMHDPDNPEGWNYDDYSTGYFGPMTTPEEIKQTLGHDIPIDPNAINVVMPGNPLDNSMAGRNDQISAWIIAHRFGHATWGVNRGEERVMAACEDMLAKTGMTPQELWTMKSARDGRMDDPPAELIAQFIITGRVRFNRTGEAGKDAVIAQTETRVNALIAQILGELVGRLVVLP